MLFVARCCLLRLVAVRCLLFVVRCSLAVAAPLVVVVRCLLVYVLLDGCCSLSLLDGCCWLSLLGVRCVLFDV